MLCRSVLNGRAWIDVVPITHVGEDGAGSCHGSEQSQLHFPRLLSHPDSAGVKRQARQGQSKHSLFMCSDRAGIRMAKGEHLLKTDYSGKDPPWLMAIRVGAETAFRPNELKTQDCPDLKAKRIKQERNSMA